MALLIKEKDGKIYEAVELREVSLEWVDERIAEAQTNLQQLDDMRQQIVELNAAEAAPVAPADVPAPSEQPVAAETPATPEAPQIIEQPAAAEATAAPAEQALPPAEIVAAPTIIPVEGNETPADQASPVLPQ